jgi:hypothetical protein
MNSPLLVVIVVIVLIVGSALTIMNKACKSGYHSWCGPISTAHHHAKTPPPYLILAHIRSLIRIMFSGAARRPNNQNRMMSAK